MLTIGSLFSGIGGLDLGLEWAGLGPVRWQVEQEAFCRVVLEKHWPGAAQFHDVRECGAHNLEPVDLICGGFPCQNVSSAGKGEGLAGSRSGLWIEFARIVEELRPRWVVVENVASGATRWVDPVVRGLAERGYEALPVPLSGQAVGAPQRRERVFIVARLADSNGERGKESDGSPTELALANPDDHRPQAIGSGRVLDGERSAFGYDAHGRSGAWPWPPGPGDMDGWRDYIEAGGPEPALRRRSHGLPCGMARGDWVIRLKALGNSVVPQCAEVVGWLIRELEEEMSNVVQHSSKSEEHLSPEHIVVPARKTLRQISLDPATTVEANELVKAKHIFTKADDGLSRSWKVGRRPVRVWLNPPGGANKKALSIGEFAPTKSKAALWWTKLIHEMMEGHVSDALFLGFSIEILQVAQGLCAANPTDFPLCVPPTRIQFDKWTPEGRVSQKQPGHANVIVCVSFDEEVKQRFVEHFGSVGEVFNCG